MLGKNGNPGAVKLYGNKVIEPKVFLADTGWVFSEGDEAVALLIEEKLGRCR